MPEKIYYYRNFDIDVNSGSLEILLWSIYAGIIIGVLTAILYRVYTGSFIKSVVDAGALDEDSAVTLDSLKFKGRWYIRRLLKPEGTLGRILVCTGGEAGEEPRYYLPEEKRVGAELRFTTEKSPVRTFILAAVIMLAVILAAIKFLPELLLMLDNLLTQLTPTSSNIL